jgi:5'-deoxynucleotidase YfbR-like HD superfamily hydrolase
LVVDLLPYRWRVGKPELALMALMHDAAEAYIGDMIKPIKIHFPKFSEIEDNIMRAIALKFDLKLEYMEVIKEYDNKAQQIEYDTFYAKTNHLNYLTPEQSNSCFIDKFYDLLTLRG